MTHSVRIKRSLASDYRWLVEFRDGHVWRLAGWISKLTDGSWSARRGYFSGTEDLGVFRLRREATAALVEKAMASTEESVQGRAAA
jgi:hypothetical protein